MTLAAAFTIFHFHTGAKRPRPRHDVSELRWRKDGPVLCGAKVSSSDVREGEIAKFNGQTPDRRRPRAKP